MTGLRRRYPHLKVTLAVGGWNEGSANYSAMASSPQSRKQFVHSALEFIQNYDFDGLDLDWEYPGKRGGKPEDKKNFVALVRELREAFDGRGWILTSAIGAGKDTLEVAYDVRALAPHLDLFHLMCYDYHGAWDSRTGHNAPLHHYPEGKQENDKYHTTEYSVNYLLELGAPPRKIVMGVPMYGRTLLIERENSLEEDKLIPPGFPAKDKGFPGPFTKEDGFMGYNEICLELMNSESYMGNDSSGKWEIGWDDASKTPYASKKDKWITYDNERSIREKVKFAMEKELGGIMVWAIDTDDFHGDCSEGGFKKFPLLNTINQAIIQVIEDQENVIPDNKHEEKHDSSASILSVPILLVSVISLLMPLFNQ
ncbi:hypothetical protein J437_LFUL010999 [Ladona fulva]|uniref:GH18 domain-containing protein n=1 Tax=Ladona fulva TaxID=123851 RepID=A0A8K0KLY5_LADFU|nr:hypothetical protein J437_LFUL010999 [Ladona fulva]